MKATQKTLLATALVAAGLFSGAAFADASDRGCEQSGGKAAGCTVNSGGQGGQGGLGGEGGQGGTGGNASATGGVGVGVGVGVGIGGAGGVGNGGAGGNATATGGVGLGGVGIGGGAVIQKGAVDNRNYNANKQAQGQLQGQQQGQSQDATAIGINKNDNKNLNTNVSGAEANAVNAGNNQSVEVNANTYIPAEQTIRYEGSYTVKNVPSMDAPNITSSNDTCMGSASGAVAGPGFGVSVGSTFTDDNCIMLKNARELWNMGMRAAALAHMCSDPEVAKSLEVTGYKCPARGDQPAAGGSQGAPAPVTDRDWNSMYRGG